MRLRIDRFLRARFESQTVLHLRGRSGQWSQTAFVKRVSSVDLFACAARSAAMRCVNTISRPFRRVMSHRSERSCTAASQSRGRFVSTSASARRTPDVHASPGRSSIADGPPALRVHVSRLTILRLSIDFMSSHRDRLRSGRQLAGRARRQRGRRTWGVLPKPARELRAHASIATSDAREQCDVLGHVDPPRPPVHVQNR